MKVISQIQQDWTAKPFVKIDSFEGNCPDGWETLFERVWHGLDEGCLYDYTQVKRMSQKEKRFETKYFEKTEFLTTD